MVHAHHESACPVCGRPVRVDDTCVRLHGVAFHVRCAVYQRRARRPQDAPRDRGERIGRAGRGNRRR